MSSTRAAAGAQSAPLSRMIDGGGAEAHRQDQQGEGEAERAVNAAGQADLDDEADDRQVERDLSPGTP